MEVLTKFLADMLDVGGSTWFTILTFSGAAVWLIRSHLSNPGFILLILPLMIGLSLIINHLFVVGEMYAANKMAEWLVWTIVAATVGALGGIGVVAAVSKLCDREPAN